MIVKFIQFGVVGFTGVLIDFAVTWFLKEILKINRFIANGIGFMAAASSNYYLNRVWTFESSNPNIAGEYLSFIIISAIGLIINTVLLYLLTEKSKFSFFGVGERGRFYISKLIAIAIVTIWNFLMNFFITFSLNVH